MSKDFDSERKDVSSATPRDAGRERITRQPHASAVILLLVLLFVLSIPTCISFITAFKNFQPVYGIAESPWVGLRNFQMFLAQPQSAAIVRNSFVLWIVTLGASCIAGLPLGLLTASIRRPALRAVATGLWLMPVFVPDICWAAIFHTLMPTVMYVETAAFLQLHLLNTLIPGACTIAFCSSAIGGAASGQENKNPVKFALYGGGIGIALCAFTAFSPNAEIIRLIQTPMNYQTSDVFSTYIYRMGLIQAQYGLACAIYVIQTLL